MVKGNIIYADNESMELLQALGGLPFFVVVHSEKKAKCNAAARVSRDFDFDHLFNAIKNLARANSDFRAKLPDYIIDLSKEV